MSFERDDSSTRYKKLKSVEKLTKPPYNGYARYTHLSPRPQSSQGCTPVVGVRGRELRSPQSPPLNGVVLSLPNLFVVALTLPSPFNLPTLALHWWSYCLSLLRPAWSLDYLL